MLSRPLVVAFALSLSALSLGCGPSLEPKASLSYTDNARRAYEQAMDEFRAHNWLESQNLMKEVRRKYSHTKFARLAELRIADADFELDKITEALKGFRQFVLEHRSDTEEVAYAKARIAQCEFKQIPDSILLPANEERDQLSVLEAYRELRGFLVDYPDSTEAPKVREMFREVLSRLVGHELYVARFYLAKDNYVATVARIEHALKTYAGLPQAKGKEWARESEAYLLLGETYLKMEKLDEAATQFEVIIGRYPKSPLVQAAKNYLSLVAEHKAKRPARGPRAPSRDKG